MTKVVTIENNGLRITSGSGGNTQIQSIQFKNNYFVQIDGDYLSIVDNEGKEVYRFIYTDFSPTPSGTVELLNTLTSMISNLDTTSTAWAYDVDHNYYPFLILTKTDGTSTYIDINGGGGTYTPSGTITGEPRQSTTNTLSTLSTLMFSSSGPAATINAVSLEVINVGVASGVFDGQTLSNIVGNNRFKMEASTINGVTYLVPGMGFDATGTEFLIIITY